MGEEKSQLPLVKDRRPDALGDMQMLPDEVICNIIDRLEARDICRLGCVSSIMYIFCNEEPLWMDQCLKDGGQLVYKKSWKLTFLCRKNLLTGQADACKKPLQFDGFISLFLYKRWYRCNTTLDAFSMDCGDIERRENLSLDEFYSEYGATKPVLITDLSNKWPARNTWTIDQLLKDYGDTTFRISQRNSMKHTMKFKDYVTYMELQHDEVPLYIFDNKFGEAAPGLLRDYEIPLMFQEDFFDVLNPDQKPPFRWLVVGPERSGASWHIDPALTSAWNTLLTGRKRWAFYPPGVVPAGVTVHVNEENGDVDIDTPSSLQWWLDIYPFLAKEDKPLECTQLPGETISVPTGWWHAVLNLEITIAVTQNFVNASNLEFVCLDMAPGHLHKGVCRAGLLAIQDLQGPDIQMDNVNYSDMAQSEKHFRKSTEKESVRSTNVDNGFRKVDGFPLGEDFSYDINFLSKFLDEEKDHYNSIWSPSNGIGQREMREWLYKLWVSKPDLRELIWKGASLALNIDNWTERMLQICGFHRLPYPSEVEKFPVGTGSNPVYLLSDYVIKIIVEGGLESAMHSLGTEVEFYHILEKEKSPLLHHVPKILASGVLTFENGVYTTKPWNNDAISDLLGLAGTKHEDSLHMNSAWAKMQFECLQEKAKAVTSTVMWPYLILERCKGDILADIKDDLSKDDGLNLASFIGHQLHNLHLIPVPFIQNQNLPAVLEMDLSKRLDCLNEVSNPVKISQSFSIPLECKLFTTLIDRRRRDLVDRLIEWGSPIPKFLIEKVEEYIPNDIALFLNFYKDMNGTCNFFGPLTWLHSDIMDDNIHMVSENCFDKTTPDSSLNDDELMVNGHVKDRLKKFRATHILDFGNLSIGDPICDIIPLYLDILRGESTLLEHFLATYGLPLSRNPCNGREHEETCNKYQKLSYRAMCYCILHEDNVLGAIFSLWGENLTSVQSWEEVEQVVWGDLNKYIPTVNY